jgi:hypothetical protein
MHQAQQSTLCMDYERGRWFGPERHRCGKEEAKVRADAYPGNATGVADACIPSKTSPCTVGSPDAQVIRYEVEGDTGTPG